MFIIPGFLIAFITFPGVIMHELGHQLACWACKVPVFDVKYFKFDLKTAGYVEHEKTSNPWKSLLITYGPFLLNTFAGVFFLLPLVMQRVLNNNTRVVLPAWATIAIYVLAYFGLSCLVQAFPSSKDAESLFTSVVKNKEVPVIFRILITPFVVVIFICSLLKFVWFDFLFAFSVPEILYAIVSHTPLRFGSFW